MIRVEVRRGLRVPRELPPYSVRVSARARRVRLTVTPREGLVVVVPKGWRGDPDAIVSSHSEWASVALSRVAEKRALHAGGAESLMPETIGLGLTGEVLDVVLRDSDAAPRAVRAGSSVVVTGRPDSEARLLALTRWLDREARALLIERFELLARGAGVRHTGVRVRRVRSRWGSCSAKGTISLSRNLVFLRPELVDSVMYHEIAHLSVLDHSARFYRTLEGLDPAWRAHRAALKEAGHDVPAWADA